MNKLVLSVGSLVVLASCSFNSVITSSSLTDGIPALVLNEDYGVKAAAAASLLTDALSGPQGGTLAARKNRRLTETEELAAIDKVHTYLGMMNQLLTESPIQTELVESDREAYDFKSIVTITGLDGTTSVFTLYFNGVVEEEPSISSSEITSSEVTSEPTSLESSSSEDTESPTSEPQARRGDDEDEEDDEEDDEDRDDMDDEYEVEDEDNDEIDDEDKDEYRDYRDRELGEETDEGDITALTGLAVVGELEYQLVGFTKTETDEIKTKYFLSLDENNWIKIATETEVDETEYQVIMKVDGQVSKMAFEIETEADGETEIKLFIKFEDTAPEMYKFKSEVHEETGGQLIRIQARIGREKFKATVLIYTDENGEVIYNYRFDGSSRDHNRDGGRDYHENKNNRDDK
jgi:hypothetical protein